MDCNASLLRRMPRDVPLTSSITPLRASACKCSSAALADLNPSSVAISARVGWGTGAGDGVLDKIQNLLLAGGEFHLEAGQVDHEDSLVTELVS